MIRLKNKFIAVCAALVVGIPNAAFAINLEVPIGDAASVRDLMDYIGTIYEFIVLAVVVLAVVMIMFSGLKWASSAGNQSMIGDAKERIKSAFFGLAIALSSYMILSLISPSLVIFNDLQFDQLEFKESYTQSAAAMLAMDICLDDTLVKYMETLPTDLLQYVHNNASEPCIQRELYTLLVNVLEDIRDAGINDDYWELKIVVNGANRAYSKQKLYWDCYQFKRQGQECPMPECSATSCSQAANPDKGKGSNHGLGLALDVSTIEGREGGIGGGHANSDYHHKCVLTKGEGSGCSKKVYNQILVLDELMQSNGFARICSEWWHFEIPGIDRECPVGVFD